MIIRRGIMDSIYEEGKEAENNSRNNNNSISSQNSRHSSMRGNLVLTLGGVISFIAVVGLGFTFTRHEGIKILFGENDCSKMGHMTEVCMEPIHITENCVAKICPSYVKITTNNISFNLTKEAWNVFTQIACYSYKIDTSCDLIYGDVIVVLPNDRCGYVCELQKERNT